MRSFSVSNVASSLGRKNQRPGGSCTKAQSLKKRRHFDALRTFLASVVGLGVTRIVAVTLLPFVSEGAMDAMTRPGTRWSAGCGLVNWAKTHYHQPDQGHTDRQRG